MFQPIWNDRDTIKWNKNINAAVLHFSEQEGTLKIGSKDLTWNEKAISNQGFTFLSFYCLTILWEDKLCGCLSGEDQELYVLLSRVTAVVSGTRFCTFS